MSKQSEEKVITDEKLLLNAINMNDVAYLLKVFSKQGNGKEYVNFKFKYDNDTLLRQAIVKGTGWTSKIVKILLDNCADPNIESFSSVYPLIEAIRVFNPEVIEMLLKIVAFGLILNGKNSYLLDPWCVLDFIIVSFSILTWILESFSGFDISFVRGFRALRALRPLRMVSKNEGKYSNHLNFC